MKHVCRGLAVFALLAFFCAGTAAQELVSVAELHAQAEAMGGWWNETVDAPGGALTVNAPVIVPDVEAMPVVTLEAGKGKAYQRNGYFKLTMEQVICGVPLFCGIIYDFGSSPYALPFTAKPQINRQIEKLNVYGRGVSSVIDYSYGRTEGCFAREESYRTITWVAKVRTVEHADVPLAPLEAVLAQVREEIAAGHIRELYAVRLGFILYADPEMTDHAWAIPRWTVDALYVTKGEEKLWARERKDIEKWG